MPSRIIRLGVWCLAPLPALLAAQQLTPADRQLVAARLWAEARTNYAYWDRVRADWDSAFSANLALAAGRPSDLQFFHALRRTLALLNDGESALSPAPSVRARLARPPLELRAVQRRVFILDYAMNDEMRIARPERLAEIVAVQGVPAEAWIRDSVLPEVGGAAPAARWERAVARMLEGEKGTALHLQLRLPGGAPRGASVTRAVSLADRWPLERAALEVDTLPDKVAWVRVNSLADPDVTRLFDRAFSDFSALQGVVLDLRENGGGAAGREAGYDILARLVDHPFVTSRWRTPQLRPAYRGQDMPDSSGGWLVAPPDTIRPRLDRPVFKGPVAVLSSPRTAGAAEDLLVAFRNAARGPIVGEPSAGSTGQVLSITLGKGWSFQLCVTRDAFPDGSEFSGLGVAPEFPVTVTVEDFLAGRDAALERAREYLSQTIRR
jgi:carboxyl-terminal processing protease